MPNRLEQHLYEQIHFLELSCISFDSGFIHESKRIATTIRVLLHDTNSSTSLLSQLNLKHKLGFYDTCLDFNPNNKITSNGLIMISVGSEAKYLAPLANSPIGLSVLKPFEDWWDKLVFANPAGVGYTRADLIKLLANKEGGSHVDPNLNKAYQKLKTGEFLEVSYLSDGTTTPITDAEAFAVRQIAFELIQSLNDKRPPNSTATNTQANRQNKASIKTGRNEKCPCGSNLKFKKCCLGR
jgi:hypothetical protein